MLETPMPLPSFASRAPKTPSVAALATLTDLVGSALSVAIPASTSNHVRNAERSAHWRGPSPCGAASTCGAAKESRLRALAPTQWAA
jgi:hypothetical protein